MKRQTRAPEMCQVSTRQSRDRRQRPAGTDLTAFQLRRLPGSEVTTNDLYLLSTPDGTKVLKLYRTRDRWRRCDRERAVLDVWARCGFRVPTVHEWVLPNVPEPYLVISFVPGISVKDFLRSADHNESRKLAMLAEIYRDMRHRHELALDTGELRLIHPDPNTGNIILLDGAPDGALDGALNGAAVWIDMEDQPRSSNLVDAAAAEICKLTRWTVRDLSIHQIDHVCNLICAAYSGHETLLKHVYSRPCDRSFQFIHRWRDRRRKRARPNEITKYDIADAMRLALARSGRQSSSLP